jgi:excisionase family DNA binding protein
MKTQVEEGKLLILTMNEVAWLSRVTPRTVRRWIAIGKLKSSKHGGVRRITAEDYQEFIENS